MLRRTKIVATLGPATDDLAELDRVIQNGLDVARVNFSHGSRADHERRVREVRVRARVHDRYVGVLVDLQGPKIRIEGFRDGAATLADGDSFVLDTRLGPRDGDASRVGVSYRNLLRDVSVGDVLLLDDGNVVMEVTAVVNEAVHCRVINGGHLSDNKGLNRQGGGLSAAALTAKDEQDIQLAAELAADFMAVSFVRDAADVQRARDLLRAAGSRGKIVAKVERAEAIENVEEIIDAADVVMIARGDLGVEIGDAELPGMQKSVIRQASPQPTRAEVLDVANAVMDGTDAVMLSAETAIGKHPGRVIKAMDRICRGAERQRSTMISTHRIDARFENVEEAIAMASMYTANHFEVRAIVAMTESGATAKWMSRISSGIPIVAMTSQEATLRRVTLYRGVYPIRLDIDDATSAEAEREILDELRRLGFVEEGESVIMTRGELTGVAGGTNSMKILLV
jgi:pyruvate kinase